LLRWLDRRNNPKTWLKTRMTRYDALTFRAPWPIITICSALMILSVEPVSADSKSTAKAITGDKIELAGKQYCLANIDAPEPTQQCTLANGKSYNCGRIATTALMDLLAGASVQCRPTKKYRNGCAIAYCKADGFDLSANMVHTGWALAAPEARGRYTTIEDKAKAGKRGLWRGRFVKPWDWRNQRSATEHVR